MDISGKPARQAFLEAILICVWMAGLLRTPAWTAAVTRAERRERRIASTVREITPALIAVRRDLHANPELSGEEVRTAGLVAERFRALGLEVRTGIAGTGVLGVLQTGRPGPVVAMRADMDALPITEETGLPFASKVKAVRDGRECGVMHACGHDIHTTVMLGVAEVLVRLKSELGGTVLFVAQPDEESRGGARRMLKEGLFREVRPEAVFAFHVTEYVGAGRITYVPGFATANVDEFRLTIKSEGCHGSVPSLCVDPIVVGSQIVVALQVMISREIDVNRNTVITVGSFHAGAAPNIIPESAELLATIRTYGEEQRAAVKNKVERLVANICGAAGAEYVLDYNDITPSLYNDPDLIRRILPTVERVLGGKNFLLEEIPEMGGEDFSEFALEVPSVLLNLGVLPKGLAKSPVHSPTFVADEDSIPVGVKVMASLLTDYMERPLKKK